MANEIVPQDDLPDEVVPEHDLPDQPGTYDPRSLVPKAIGAGAGAVLGPVASAVAKSGVKQVQQGRVSPPPSISVPHPSEVTPGHTPYKATGVSVEDSVSNWKSYNEAQLEAAKKVRQESALHKKYPGFTRAGPQLEIPQLPANATWAQKAGSKMWPGAASDVANFAKGVSEYRLPLIGQVGPLVGHLVGGAATGAQAVDAYNRGLVQDDTTGGVISGIGAVGTGISTLPFPPVVRGIGAGVGLSAEAINAYRDAMREGRIEHGAPEHPENTTSIGDTYAQGGLVHLAGGGQPNMQAYAPGASRGIAPYGFRHVENVSDVSLPKGTGWMGALPNQTGGISTEISADSNGSQYPLINPNMNHQDINSLLANQQPTDEMYRKAEQWAKYRQTQGKGPFISPVGEVRWSAPKLAEGGQPPKPEANEGGAFIGYPQINKNRKIGSGTGFLDALVGAPPSRQNVLDPSHASYMEGYEKGEPYGIASSTLQMGAPIAKGAMLAGTIARPSISEMLNALRNSGGTATATRLERAADLVPNLEHQFQPQALERAFTGDNAQAVMVMPPKNFEKYAAPIDTGYKSSVMETYGIGDPEKYGGYNNMPKGTYQNYIDYLGQFTRPGGGGLSDVPYLQLGQELNSSFPAVLGHEGRHRTAALEKLGDQSTLVRMMPRAALREPFPRRSQEEYLNALVEQIGQKPLVKPQVYRDDAGKDVRRGLIELPEMFKKGGDV